MKRMALAIALLSLLSLLFWTRSRAEVSADFPIYTDQLPVGLQDWSWDATVALGTQIDVTYTAPWGSVYLHPDAALDTTNYTHIRFEINGGVTGGQFVQFKINDATLVYDLHPTANTWTQIDVPLTALGNPATISDFYWQDGLGAAQPLFSIDNVRLVNANQTDTPIPNPTNTPMPNSNRVQLQIDLSAPSHPISPYIYGLHNADEAFATEIALPVRRWGGNDTTRYNWKNDATSSALDWYFGNKSADMTMSNFLARNQRTNTASLITMPMTGWVAKNSSNGTCGFSTAKYNYAPLAWASHGMATATAPFFPQCGTGIIGFNGSGYPIFYNNIAGTDGEGLPIFQAAVDPNDTSIPFGSADATEWVTSLVGQYGSAENGGVPFYALDNEPDIWWQSHPDVAPIGYNYDDFVARSQEYAAAIKAGDPSAQVLGPVVSNWAYFFNSFYDGQREDWATPNDRTAHGGVPFLEWYLQQMQAYETQTGVRLLDYLDVHFYPQSGQYNSTAGNSAAQALRLRSTQSLWNPTYQDESWIGSAGIDGGVVQLIPRLRQLVDQNYRGTKTAITEYSWGSHESLNGALTQADILGIFGREGLDFATLFDSVYENAASRFQPDRPSAYAFRVYRNYDGNGSQFGDLSISATSMLNGVDNQSNLAIYAAQRSSDNVLTLVVINKTANPISADLSLVGLARNSQAVAADSATVYRYSAADLTAIANEGTIELAQNQLTADYPANSITLLAVPLVAQTPTGIGRLLSGESESPNLWIIVALVLVGLSWVTVKLWSQRFGR